MTPLGPAKSQYADGPAGTSLVTTAETVVATLAGVDVTQEGDQVVLEGVASINPGTAATSIWLRCRRGGVNGPQVGPIIQQAVTAGAVAAIPFQGQDTPPEGDSYIYVLTATQVAATGNGTCNVANLQATF